MAVTPGRPQADSAGDGPGSGRTGPPARAPQALEPSPRSARRRTLAARQPGGGPSARPEAAGQARARPAPPGAMAPTPGLLPTPDSCPRPPPVHGQVGRRPGEAPGTRGTASPLPRSLGALSAPVGSGRSHFGASGDKERVPIAAPSRPRPRSLPAAAPRRRPRVRPAVRTPTARSPLCPPPGRRARPPARAPASAARSHWPRLLSARRGQWRGARRPGGGAPRPMEKRRAAGGGGRAAAPAY